MAYQDFTGLTLHQNNTPFDRMFVKRGILLQSVRLESSGLRSKIECGDGFVSPF